MKLSTSLREAWTRRGQAAAATLDHAATGPALFTQEYLDKLEVDLERAMKMLGRRGVGR